MPVEPLRVTCAGCIRPEKGHQHLNGLVQALWRDYFSTGRIQLVMQTDQSNPLAMIPWASYARARTKDPALEFVRFPLARPDYLQLIHRTHIGLFTYDSERYYTRCSGVLVEMLSAGIPVIVPAGCWLSEQIAEPIFQHQQHIAAQLPHVAHYGVNELAWQRVDGTRVNESDGLSTCGAGNGVSAELTVQQPASLLLVQLDTSAWQTGCYGRVICEQQDAAGRFLDRSVSITGRRTESPQACSTVMFHLSSAAARLRLTLENAFQHQTLALRDVQLSLLDSSSRPGGCPTGSVGLIAADPGEVSALLREMLEHYPHYQSSALQFAAAWNRKHAPSQTVIHLRQRAAADESQSASRRAA